MNYMVRDIVDFGLILKNQLHLTYSTGRIESIISECMDVLRFKAEKKNLGFMYSHINNDGSK